MKLGDHQYLIPLSGTYNKNNYDVGILRKKLSKCVSHDFL